MPKPNVDVKWYRTPLPKATLEALNRRSDLKGAAQAGGYLLLITLTGLSAFLAWKAQQGWLLVLALFLHGTVCSFFPNAVHELVHGTVFRTRWLNELFVHIYGFIGWINHRMFWLSHTEHHKYTLHPPDDLEVIVPQYHSNRAFWSTALIDFKLTTWIIPQLRYASNRFVGAWESVLVEQSGEKRRRQVVNWSRVILLGHIVIAAVSLYYGYWIIPVIVSLTPAYANWLFWLCNNTQHAGLVENVDDFRLNCRTCYLNPWARFLYWHMNWHIEHHMYAAVPCYNLAKLHRAILHDLPKCPNGLIQTWVEIAYIQYRQKEDPEYRFIAELPGADGASHSKTSRLQQIRAQADSRKQLVGVVMASGRRWQCAICGFIYDEARGLPEEGIAPGTAWDAIPDDWSCPDCGVSKAEFEMVELPSAQKPVEAPVASDVLPIVIVGSGLAGYHLAREFRKLNHTQPLRMLTEDKGAFYSKPMLSNGFSKAMSADDLVQSTAAEMSQELSMQIDTHCNVQSINRERRVLLTSQGEICYAQLVLAVGADPIRLSLQGDAVDQVLSVNNLKDYEALRAALSEKSRVAIIGDGLIGSEFANDLLLAGHQVSVIGLGAYPLEQLLPMEVGQHFQEVLAAKGVEWHLQHTAVSVTGRNDGFHVVLSDGEALTVDVVLSAVGLQPRKDLAQQAGLEVSRGICVNNQLQTNDASIYALGDCAEVEGRVRPFVMPIMRGAQALAMTLSGRPTGVDYSDMPIHVKTRSYPMEIHLPAEDLEVIWSFEGGADGMIARGVDAANQLCGFVLTGAHCAHRSQLVSELGVPRSAEEADAGVAS